MGLLRRRNRRSALADRRLMAQLLRGQLDRLACAKYGMRLLVFPKIFKAGLGTSGAQVTFLGTACPLGVHASGPVMPVAGFLGIGLTVSEAWRMSPFRQGVTFEISLHGLSPSGKTTGYQWTWLSRST